MDKDEKRKMISLLLIEPFGIETQHKFAPETTFENLLIEPFGIETFSIFTHCVINLIF